LTDNRVTIGCNAAKLSTKEVAVMDKLQGNVVVRSGSMRAQGSLSGDVVAHRLSIEDGALFKGSVDLKRSEQKPATSAKSNAGHSHPQPSAMGALAGKA